MTPVELLRFAAALSARPVGATEATKVGGDEPPDLEVEPDGAILLRSDAVLVICSPRVWRARRRVLIASTFAARRTWSTDMCTYASCSWNTRVGQGRF